MMGFKAFHAVSATLAGIEVTHMIRKTHLPMITARYSMSLPGWRHKGVHS